MLDAVQLDEGKLKFTFVDFNVKELLIECLNLISIQAKMKKIKLELEIQTNIITSNSDPNRIR